MSTKDACSVQVALRVRPMIKSELEKGCKDIMQIHEPLNQIQIKEDKSFTFNHVFGPTTKQDIFYNKSVQPLLSNLFKGYNVTILAYGQTGSGKTHTMGTSYSGEDDSGVIPRVVREIFSECNDMFSHDFIITVSFMELYQEVLYDLLSNKPRDQCALEIREDNRKNIIIPGLTEVTVITALKTLELLTRGSKGRATSSTNMNQQSSRSHAIFTINISMTKKGTSETKTSKFHLVDLAGSERSKKTGATGQTLKEGININKGLLSLGNVISALGDEKSKDGFICYRDSNLTRLLKDSLGGNSITLMIACISPADYNMEETISTLRYADRARKIKNKPIINEDPKASEISRLNKLVQQYRMELMGQGGSTVCHTEFDNLNKAFLESKLKSNNLTLKLTSCLNDNAILLERILLMQTCSESFLEKLKELKEMFTGCLEVLQTAISDDNIVVIKEQFITLQNIQLKFVELDKESKKSEDEIKKHEISVARNSTVSSSSNEEEFSKKQESHAAQQIELNTELQAISKMLAQKEDLAQQIAINSCYMVDMKEIAENESKISSLQAEKDELLMQLKAVQVTGANTKVAEQRRKRVQELEHQIQDLNKKINELARLLKLKEKDEQKIRVLNQEICGMKSKKVQLIKSMRTESEKFRTWKQQRERELIKLKDQDKKRVNAMQKMESLHSRQQNVLKRKVEEAAAINKRLKDALSLRKTAKDTKMAGKIERFGPWVQREFDVYVSTIDAKATLEILMEDRETLNMHLESLKSSSDPSDNDIKQLEEDLELRSLQIQELQQKILDSDEENKSNHRFDSIQTMSEAKYVINELFTLVAGVKKTETTKDFKLNETQTHLKEALDKNKEQEGIIHNLRSQYSTDLANIDKEYEEKISILLRQLRGVKVENPEINERNEIEMNNTERLETEITTLRENNLILEQRIDEISNLLQAQDVKSNKEKKPILSRNGSTYKEPIWNLDSPESDIENRKNDPDWRLTPLAKRVQKIRIERADANETQAVVVKRTSKGGCTCKGSCHNRTCGCKKIGTSCGEGCKCQVNICVNRLKQEHNELEDIDEPNKENESAAFKKPRSATHIKRKKLFEEDNESSLSSDENL